MIAALTGQLRSVTEGGAQLECGPILYELLVPAADLAELQSSRGREITFHTIFYLSGDPSRGGMDPLLIGFLRPQDKRFFELFTTVKGIGPKRALRALSVPVGQIVSAIENRDARFLVGLPEIGKRTAEQIIAELSGKLKDFAASTPRSSQRSRVEEDAIAALIELGERRGDAENLLEAVKAAEPNLKTAEQLLREMLRRRGGR